MPSAHIGTAVRPFHYSIAVAFILKVVSAIYIPRLPLENTIAVLLVQIVFALVCVGLVLTQSAVGCTTHLLALPKSSRLELPPLSMSVLQSVLKLAFIDRTI